MSVISSVCLVLANWESDDGGGDEYEIHHHEHGLELAHDLGQDRSQDSMARYSCQENTVNGSVGGGVIAILSNDKY